MSRNLIFIQSLHVYRCLDYCTEYHNIALCYITNVDKYIFGEVNTFRINNNISMFNLRRVYSKLQDKLTGKWAPGAKTPFCSVTSYITSWSSPLAMLVLYYYVLMYKARKNKPLSDFWDFAISLWILCRWFLPFPLGWILRARLERLWLWFFSLLGRYIAIGSNRVFWRSNHGRRSSRRSMECPDTSPLCGVN